MTPTNPKPNQLSYPEENMPINQDPMFAPSDLNVSGVLGPAKKSAVVMVHTALQPAAEPKLVAEHTAEPGVSQPNRVRHIGRKAVAAVVGGIMVISAGVGIDRFINRGNNSTHSRSTPTAAPAPAPEKPLPNLTLAVPEQPAPIEAPTPELLPAAEKQRIIDITHIEGLADLRLEVISEFDTKTGHIKVMRLVGAKLTVPLVELQRDLNIAEVLSAEHLSRSAWLQLSPNAPLREVKYSVSSGNPNQDVKDTHYFIVAKQDQDLAKIAAPKITSPDCFTSNAPNEGIHVTVIRDLSKEDHAKYANNFCAAVEALQSSITVKLDPAFEQQLDQERPDMSSLQNPNLSNPTYQQQKYLLVRLLQEIEANSLATAMIDSRAGKLYSDHRIIEDMLLKNYAATQAHYRPADPVIYRWLAEIQADLPALIP